MSPIEVASNDLRMFGLRVRSAIPVPVLLRACVVSAPTGGNPDVQVGFGVVEDPATAESRVARAGMVSVMADGGTVVDLPGIGRFAMSNGRDMVIEPVPGADRDGIWLAAFGMCFAYLLIQRDVIPLHASALETPAGVIALLAQSGHGKSTTAAALMDRGHDIVADDLVAVARDGGHPMVVGEDLPHLRVWRDVARAVGLETAGSQDLRPGGSRVARLRPVRPRGRRPLAGGIFLEFDNTLREPRLEPVSTFEAVVRIRPHIFGHRPMIARHGPDWVLPRQTGIASKPRFARLIRPRDIDSLPRCLALIEAFADGISDGRPPAAC